MDYGWIETSCSRLLKNEEYHDVNCWWWYWFQKKNWLLKIIGYRDWCFRWCSYIYRKVNFLNLLSFDKKDTGFFSLSKSYVNYRIVT